MQTTTTLSAEQILSLSLQPIQASTIVFAILCVKVFLTNFYTGKLKRVAGQGPPEDNDPSMPNQPQPTKADIEAYERWSRICSNDAENIPYGILAGMFSALLCTLQGGATVNGKFFTADLWQIGLFGSYAFCRLMHTWIYARGVQPWRTIFYVLGQACFISLIVLMIVIEFG